MKFSDNIKEFFCNSKEKRAFYNTSDKLERRTFIEMSKTLKHALRSFKLKGKHFVEEFTPMKGSYLEEYAVLEGCEAKTLFYINGDTAIIKLCFLDNDESKFDEYNWPKEYDKEGLYFIASNAEGKFDYCVVTVMPSRDRGYNYFCNDGYKIEKNSDMEMMDNIYRSHMGEEKLQKKHMQAFIENINEVHTALSHKFLDNKINELEAQKKQAVKDIEGRTLN